MTDHRSNLIDLFDRAKVAGVAYLFVIVKLASASVSELREITGDDAGTISKYLNRLESRGLLVRVQDGTGHRWHPSADATQQLQPAHLELPGNFFPSLSSSSDQSVQSSNPDSDQIKSEEEERPNRDFKTYLCKEYGFTGDRARQIIEDDRIWGEDICAWMHQVLQMKRDGYKFRKSAESYALACLLKPGGPDEPPETARHNANTDWYWNKFEKHLEYAKAEQ